MSSKTDKLLNPETLMVEEIGKVVAIEGNRAVIETEQKSACDHCNSGDSCGTSVLASFFSRRSNKVKVLNHLNLSKGEYVVIGINESVLLITAALAYMLPLMFLIIFSVIANLSGLSDNISFVSGMLGLFIGMKVSNQIMGNQDYQSKEIVLLRKANESHINFRGHLT